LVERTVRDREVGGSNPLAPTISFPLFFNHFVDIIVGLVAEGFGKGFGFGSQRRFNCSPESLLIYLRPKKLICATSSRPVLLLDVISPVD
jgi:hypothetical protein